jgi:hypothetical protein
MDAGDESMQAQSEDTGHKEVAGTDRPDAHMSGDASGSDVTLREGGELPTGNPDFSVAGLNPAFTHASAPPPPPPDEATGAPRDAKIRELERLLAQAGEQIERGAAALERSRRRR